MTAGSSLQQYLHQTQLQVWLEGIIALCVCDKYVQMAECVDQEKYGMSDLRVYEVNETT